MPDHAAFEQAFGAALAGQPHGWSDDAAVVRALAVHLNTATKAACDALEANYPVIAMLVGKDAFAACAADFAAEHPPSEARLCLYGAGFDVHVRDYAPFATLGWLGGLASLEHLVVEALFAADAPAFDGATIDLDRSLRLHPAARTLQLDGPAVGIWQAHQPGGDTDALESLPWTTDLALVTRPGAAVTVTAIDAVSARFIADCNAGRTLGEAASTAAEQGGDLSTIFAALVGAGSFAAS